MKQHQNRLNLHRRISAEEVLSQAVVVEVAGKAQVVVVVEEAVEDGEAQVQEAGALVEAVPAVIVLEAAVLVVVTPMVIDLVVIAPVVVTLVVGTDPKFLYLKKYRDKNSFNKKFYPGILIHL